VLTSCGAQLKDDHPMAQTNDLSYRLLHRDIPLSELKVSHMTPVRKWALDDLNVAYPRDRLIELEKNGVFKKLATNAVSLVGSITLYTELLNEMAPRIKEEFDKQEVDLALILPF
jgi:D-proline reductase (dithiol) PrdB